MLTKLKIRNFKVFDEVEIELGERVLFVGPNNSGKTTALQALALWSAGVRRWVEKRGSEPAPKERAGVTINRRDLIAVPVPQASLIWKNLHVREGYQESGKTKTRNVLIDVEVEGFDNGEMWTAALEFDYANEESFYCRSKLDADGRRRVVPEAAAEVRFAYLPPMSGLASNETRLDEGAIDVRIGEGRTAEVLRNLCYQASQRKDDTWKNIIRHMRALFGVELEPPMYIKERGEIVMAFRTADRIKLDLSASGRGQQQTLLLLAHMAAHPGSVLLLDEPDAHLEILRQRQIYQVLSNMASATGSQIIVASHSEIILNEAGDRDIAIAFVGKPHRIDDRTSGKQQVLKALREIGFEHYLQAEEMGWVLYLEGSTDLEILRSFALKTGHDAARYLEKPFVHYVGNQFREAQKHFYGLREAKPDLAGLAIFDRLDNGPDPDPNLPAHLWRRREIENYVCHRETLLTWAAHKGRDVLGELFAVSWHNLMAEIIDKVAAAQKTLNKPSPWGPDIKASDDFLDPLFENFYEELELPNLMRKTNYHTLVKFVRPQDIDPEIEEKLDRIVEVASRAKPAV